MWTQLPDLPSLSLSEKTRLHTNPTVISQRPDSQVTAQARLRASPGIR